MSKPKARTPALNPGARKQKESAKSPLQSSENGAAPAGTETTTLNGHLPAAGAPANKAAEIAEKIKELVRLAQEQGYLTYGDVNDALPDTVVTAEELDEIYIKLRNLDVEIVDQAEVDRVKQPE